jgi:hypothetical protein
MISVNSADYVHILFVIHRKYDNKVYIYNVLVLH